MLPDPRNAEIRIWVGDRLHPRGDARVSVFDSAVQGGDAVWEGLRVYDGGIFRLSAHLDRLEASARALAFEQIPPRGRIVAAIAATIEANGMRNDAHIRLTLTRGVKLTSGMSPRWNTSGCTLIVLAEWKPPVSGSGVAGRGLRLITSTVRRNAPQCLPSRIYHANLLNNILARIEAEAAGADDAIMLDIGCPRGSRRCSPSARRTTRSSRRRRCSCRTDRRRARTAVASAACGSCTRDSNSQEMLTHVR